MLASFNAIAATWTVTSDITVREVYTDNVSLGAAERRSDYILEVRPGIQLEGYGPNLSARLSYRPSAVFYRRSTEANNVANRLNGFGRLEAIERFFFVEASADVSQTFISPFAPRPADITTISENRVETRTLSLSPYVRGERGGVAYELRSRNQWSTTDRNALGDFHTRQWTGRLNQRGGTLGWAAEFDDTHIEYEDARQRPDQEWWLYRGILYYRPSIDWEFHASAGREENNFLLEDERRRHTMRGAGVAWRPTPRTRADLRYESRYFGPSRLARFIHRTRLTAWNIEYSRTASNYQQELLRLPPGDTAALLDAIFAARIPDPAERATAVGDFLRITGAPPFLADPLSFFTQRIFVREGVDASFSVLGVRNSITLTVFAAESTALTPELEGVLEDTFLSAARVRQRGFAARADHRFTAFTSLAATATRSHSRSEEPPGPRSRNDHLALTLNHRVAPDTRVFGGASVTRFDADQAAAANRDATSLFIGVSHRF